MKTTRLFRYTQTESLLFLGVCWSFIQWLMHPRRYTAQTVGRRVDETSLFLEA
jgi:hypothetical protein